MMAAALALEARSASTVVGSSRLAWAARRAFFAALVFATCLTRDSRRHEHDSQLHLFEYALGLSHETTHVL